MAESEEELNSLLMKAKEESEKFGLKLNIQKTKIMASGPITSWEIDGETVETVADFILGGSKVTADGDDSHKIKRHLLLGRKLMNNLDSILKRRNSFASKGTSNQGYGCECWTIKKVESKSPLYTSVSYGLLDSEGEGEGGMIWENGILTCILSCKNVRVGL